MTNKKGDKADTVTNKKEDKGRQAGRKADTLSRSKADTLRKALRTANSNLFGEVQKSPGKQMNRHAGKGKRADASSAGTEPGRQK